MLLVHTSNNIKPTRKTPIEISFAILDEINAYQKRFAVRSLPKEDGVWRTKGQAWQIPWSHGSWDLTAWESYLWEHVRDQVYQPRCHNRSKANFTGRSKRRRVAAYMGRIWKSRWCSPSSFSGTYRISVRKLYEFPRCFHISYLFLNLK
jgi:hypothetical protein